MTPFHVQTMFTTPIIQVEASTFVTLLNQLESPFVITARGKSLFSSTHQYMTSYKGFVLFTDVKQPLQLSEKVEMIEAENIWLPNM